MGRNFIFCVVIGFVCLYQPATSNIIRNAVSDFESRLDESLAGPFKKIKMLESELTHIRDGPPLTDILKVQLTNAVENRIKEFLSEMKSFYSNLKTESEKSGVLPDTNKNLFDLKLLDLAPKYMDLFYTDVVAIILHESRLYEDEKLTIIHELRPMLDMAKKEVIPQIKKEITDHPQDWTGAGLLGMFFSFGEDESELSTSEMAAAERFQEIMQQYQLSFKLHADKIDAVGSKFRKRVKEQNNEV